MYTKSYLASDPKRRDIEDFTPDEIKTMSLETFDQLSYKEQVILRKHFPDTYNRLIEIQELKQRESANRYQ